MQTVNMGPIAPWPRPKDLAGLLWLENQLPFLLASRPNLAAQRPMLPELMQLHLVQSHDLPHLRRNDYAIIDGLPRMAGLMVPGTQADKDA
jgi:hypothetical protein